MKMTLLTVGKTDKGWIREGLEIYMSRLKHYVPFHMNVIPELKNVSALMREQIKARERELILKIVLRSVQLVLLDWRGGIYSSTGLAGMLQDKMARSGRDMVFVIGGAYGFSDEVYRRAGSMLSLSKMTFSHQMVRVIFAEQIYRAFTIMRGEPYHHE